MNYVEDIRSDLDARLPGLDPELIRLYTLLVLVKGMNTRLEDVHDAWAIWCNGTRPSHPSLVPFDELSAEVQSYDRPYRDVIVQLTREYIDEAEQVLKELEE